MHNPFHKMLCFCSEINLHISHQTTFFKDAAMTGHLYNVHICVYLLEEINVESSRKCTQEKNSS